MIGLLFAVALSADAASTEIQYDTSCAEAAGWALSWMDASTEAAINVRNVDYYYLGKLNGEDGSIDWLLKISDSFVHHPRTDAEYEATLEGCGQRMIDRVSSKIILPAPH